MLIIVDRKIPEEAKLKLAAYGRLIEFETSGITYAAISGHPDIFFHKAGSQLIVAPNVPEKYMLELKNAGVQYLTGEEAVGEKYPQSSAYNAVSTPGLLIHNFRNTDSSITSSLEDAELIHVDQGYTRCNLIGLGENHFITSDKGIARVMERLGKDCLLVDPQGIILEGFEHGFFGGCCGLLDNKLFVLGAMQYYPEGKKVMTYLAELGIEVIELYNGLLFDGGSILFIEQ